MRTNDGDIAHEGHGTAGTTAVARRAWILKPLPHLLNQHGRITRERNADVMSPSLDRHAQVKCCTGRIRVGLPVARCRTKHEVLDQLAVDGHLNPVFFTQPAVAAQLNPQVIISIKREPVVDQHSAAGTEGQPLGSQMLLLVLRRPEGFGNSRRGRTTNRQTANGPTRHQIPFK